MFWYAHRYPIPQGCQIHAEIADVQWFVVSGYRATAA